MRTRVVITGLRLSKLILHITLPCFPGAPVGDPLPEQITGSMEQMMGSQDCTSGALGLIIAR